MTNDKNTACALNTLGIHSKRPRLINTAQQLLESLDVKFVLSSVIARGHHGGAWRTVQKLERRANQLIMKVDR